jgi:diaminohydroxyphosphoribosylaminopyrimidine deaminase/5-amino-6-(5-phosphoribosylamino)uracil reductase
MTAEDLDWMRLALRLAKRGYGRTSPNPMVGAVLVRRGKIIGSGWHRQAGQPHAEIEAIHAAQRGGHELAGSTLYVTLEPCCTQGRTGPCTDAILGCGMTRVVAAATDPNPKHRGRGFEILRRAGISVVQGVLATEAEQLNESFNHWILRRTPLVTVKAALSLDGKIATAAGESKWITGEKARSFGMRLRRGADAILVGVNTVVRDDPRLTVRRGDAELEKRLRRIVLDSAARIPLQAKVLADGNGELTTVVVSDKAPARKVAELRKRANVMAAPLTEGRIDLGWLLARLGQESVTSLLVEGGGEVNASFLLGGFAQRVVFFYAPLIMGGRAAPGAVGGDGIQRLTDAISLRDMRIRRLGPDLLLTARISSAQR